MGISLIISEFRVGMDQNLRELTGALCSYLEVNGCIEARDGAVLLVQNNVFEGSGYTPLCSTLDGEFYTIGNDFGGWSIIDIPLCTSAVLILISSYSSVRFAADSIHSYYY